MSTKALGYVRVSREEQVRNGISLDAQEAKIRQYATLNGLELIDVIREEGVSGMVPLNERPAGNQVAALGRKSEARHVITWKLDRLFRDATDALEQTRSWDQGGIALHLIDQGGAALNTASAMGRFFLSVMASFAELERNLIAERTTFAIAHLKAERRAYNHAPIGFTRVGDRLEENQEEMRVVRRIKAERAAGRTLQAIANGLRHDRVPTKTKGATWHPSTIRAVLRNTIHEAPAAIRA